MMHSKYNLIVYEMQTLVTQKKSVVAFECSRAFHPTLSKVRIGNIRAVSISFLNAVGLSIHSRDDFGWCWF